jgi:hypothetical protein
MKKRGTFMVPTLVAPVWVLRYAERAPESLHPQSIRKAMEVTDEHKGAVARALEAGVRIAFGTDQGVGPHGRNAEELGLLVYAGMTPMQAIVAATKTASECVHMADDVGTLEAGKLADLLVVDGDPLADIGIMMDREKLQVIMQGGRAHKNLLDVETLTPTLREWKAQQRVRYIGITHYASHAYLEIERLLRTRQYDFVQINYSLAESESEKTILPLAQELGVAVIANRPFAEGAMFRRVRGKVLPAWAAELGVTSWAQYFLKWIVSHPAVTCTIPGTGKIEHMQDNLAAGFGAMPDETQRRRMSQFYDTL